MNKTVRIDIDVCDEVKDENIIENENGNKNESQGDMTVENSTVSDSEIILNDENDNERPERITETKNKRTIKQKTQTHGQTDNVFYLISGGSSRALFSTDKVGKTVILPLLSYKTFGHVLTVVDFGPYLRAPDFRLFFCFFVVATIFFCFFSSWSVLSIILFDFF